MCKSIAEGGQRCYTHASARLNRAADKLSTAETELKIVEHDHTPGTPQHTKASHDVDTARADYRTALVEFASTKQGRADLHRQFMMSREMQRSSEQELRANGPGAAGAPARIASAKRTQEALTTVMTRGSEQQERNFLVSRGWNRADADQLDSDGLAKAAATERVTRREENRQARAAKNT